MHTYIHTCIHTHIHTYIHTVVSFIQTAMCVSYTHKFPQLCVSPVHTNGLSHPLSWAHRNFLDVYPWGGAHINAPPKKNKKRSVIDVEKKKTCYRHSNWQIGKNK